MAPPIRYTPTTIAIAWKDLNDSQVRSRGMRLSPFALADIIPHGSYCYTVLGTLPAPAVGHRIRRCLFIRGTRPDTLCLINPDRSFRDHLYNEDACKGCGINDEERPEHFK
jgi:hypothetical protein